MNTPEIVFGYLGGVVILGVFVWIGVALHMAYTKLDELLDHLKNCSAIMVRAPLRHGGPWGKLLLIGGISGIVTFPGFYLKRGELSAEDLNNFPAPFKRKLVVLQWSVIGLLGFAFLLWVIGKVVGWHK
ncbi:hypothetical protein [Pseudomonas sp. GW531-T4]|uniref:hypothetical protein n=1 Tax=Pseudomonas sp. GW531-T4 TaxID=2075553 RepID=UPI000CD318FF|nr:hypothetical protein [Pseudomonas sp. GW531-T4]POA64761.1 hypothetical protein C1888_26175 [Pseudomonas sp. GW531-T4]